MANLLESNGAVEKKTQVVFEADEDTYDGVKVQINELMDSNHFVTMLRASISQWRKQVSYLLLLLQKKKKKQIYPSLSFLNEVTY